jgi:transcriptional regulator with XRE-family HTH domain
MTQEELASALFVSRTAISKWESGRGYPSIDSLKTIATFFGVTVDSLLSGEELLMIAEVDRNQREGRLRDLIFGLLDLFSGILFFLPFFGDKTVEGIRAASLLTLTGVSEYLKIGYFSVVIGMVLLGLVTLALQNCKNGLWISAKHKASFALSTAGTVLFVVSLQPYAASLLLLFLIIKALMLIQWH